jgi:Protein of unknown function (DUF3800)
LLSYLRLSWLVAAMKCYFDGSVGGQSDRWMSLAGLVATDSVWGTFQKRWETMLRERYPVAPFLHMTDLITGNDPFERKAGWTEEKVDDLVGSAERLLASLDQRQICAFSCSIDYGAHKRLRAEGYKISDPAVICAEIGLGNLISWYREKHGIEMADLFYDQGEPFIRSIKQEWQKHEDRKQRVTDDLFWGLIGNVMPVRMTDTPGIQASDMVAWATTRRLLNLPNDKWHTLANTLIGMRGPGKTVFSGVLTATQLDPIDETVMRNNYQKTPGPPP